MGNGTRYRAGNWQFGYTSTRNDPRIFDGSLLLGDGESGS